MLKRLSRVPTGCEVKFARADLTSVETDGAFSGYASVFGQEDLGRDIVMPGAFAESLRKRGPSGIKLLFQHDPNELIGVWQEIREDARGLWVRGQLMTEVARAREVLSLMRAGALDGLSIGFRTVQGQRDPTSGVRRLHKIDLWEISVVTFPMLPDARVEAVKRRRGEGPPPFEAGDTLTHEASGLDAFLLSGFKTLATRLHAAGGATPHAGLPGVLRRAAASINPTPKRTI